MSVSATWYIVVVEVPIVDRTILVLLLQLVQIIPPPAFPGRRHSGRRGELAVNRHFRDISLKAGQSNARRSKQENDYRQSRLCR